MRSHVAIVRPGVALALLRGVKRIETRFYRQRRPPWGRISPGDLVHFKLSGGAFIGSTQVLFVKEVASLTPRAIARLRRTYGRAIHASAAYWSGRRTARYGVLTGLGLLSASPRSIAIPRQYGSGWLVLRES
jgi:hypothetical protein